MNITLLTLALGFIVLSGSPCVYGQKSLRDYIEVAANNSPLLKGYGYQVKEQQIEAWRLRAVHTKSRLELTGECLFVPIVSNDGGHTSFKCNAQDGTDYYGYDLGESSGHTHAGVVWTQPLLGYRRYKAEQELAAVAGDMAANRMHMERHQLERSVTEQYLLCLLDQTQKCFLDSVGSLIIRNIGIVRRLVTNGLASQADLQLLYVEQASNDEMRAASLQSFHSHLAELNVLCGIVDTSVVCLDDVYLSMLSPATDGHSGFSEQFRLDSLKEEASLRVFNMQYFPRLDLRVEAGLQTGSFAGWYRHFGWSVGLNFSWTISDGGQKHWKRRQADLRQNSIRICKESQERQRQIRLSQCVAELNQYDERQREMDRKLVEYEKILSLYDKKIGAGQLSVLDYLTVLKDKIQAERDRLILQANRNLLVAAYNYWSW